MPTASETFFKGPGAVAVEIGTGRMQENYEALRIMLSAGDPVVRAD